SLFLHRSGLSPPAPCRFNRRTERFELNLTVSPRITRGRGGWLDLTPWKTLTSYPLPTKLAHSARGQVQTDFDALIRLVAWSLVPSRADVRSLTLWQGKALRAALSVPSVLCPADSAPIPLSSRRTRNGQDVAHVRCECRAKDLGIARNGMPLVPLDDITVSQRSSPMNDSSEFQPVTVGAEHGRDDGDPLSGFSEREQCVRRPALK